MTEYVHCELCKHYFTAKEHGDHVCKWSDESRRAALKARRGRRKGMRSGKMIRRLRRIHNMRGPRGRYAVARRKVNRS